MVEDSIIEDIYSYVSGIAFLPESVYSDQKSKKQIAVGKNVNSFFYKTLRGAFNCIANLLAQENSVYIRSVNPAIFAHLK